MGKKEGKSMNGRLFSLAALLGSMCLGAEGALVEPVKPRLGLNLPPFRRLLENRLFAVAKEPASVIAIGLDGATNLGLYIYDEHGNCVAWDDLASSSTRDDTAVQWFPVQKERFTIELRNLGMASSRFDIVVR
jgi:hypothetical protein